MVHVTALDHLVLTVADVERSMAWYGERLGLAAEGVEEWRAGRLLFPSLRIDEGTIIDLVAGMRSGANVAHICLVVDTVELADVAASGAFEVVSGPSQVSGARGVGEGLYVRDPDDNVIELRRY